MTIMEMIHEFYDHASVVGIVFLAFIIIAFIAAFIGGCTKNE